ncbi:MAG: glycosyltransferase [Chloroflexi bacterium]|nr:glycosyltransferase [Chloroflexota bacterium]
MGEKATAVSIIIPSLNSPLIDQVVAALVGQAQAEVIREIVVVGKDEAGLLPVGGRVRLVDTGQPVPPGTARNLGIRAATADLLIFLDSDCLPQPGWLAAHLAAHRAGHAVVGGGVLPDGENYWALSYNLTMFHEYFSTAPADKRPLLPTLNLSVERQVIDAVGLLNEALPRSQDLDWTTRMNQAGFQPYFWPEAAIQHRHNRTTAGKVWQDCARSGHFARQARLAHRETLDTPLWLRWRWLVLLLSPLIAAAVTGKIVGTRPFILRRHAAAIPAIYLSKIAWCWGASRREPPS